LHNDELHSLYSSPNIFRVIKSRRMRWVGHVARVGIGEVFTGFWLGGPKGRDHWKDLGVGGRITLNWNLGRLGSVGQTGFGWLMIGSSGVHFEHCNETSGSIKKAKQTILNKLSVYQVFRRYAVIKYVSILNK
jgi:hypothetical protein